jgi:putative glutamine amidotransferase
MARPRIAILARFAENTSATRYAAVVTARRLAEVVWAAGGEPLTMLPVAGSDWSERLAGIDGVLMPGGSDINPQQYGQEVESDEVYDVDDVQDDVDIDLVRYVFAHGMPVLTVCRGTQIANVALGGSLVQHMETPHRHVVNPVTVTARAAELGLTDVPVNASCYHHQAIDRLGTGVTPIAVAHDGVIEAVAYDSPGWAFGMQWHPEDNWDSEPENLAIVTAFVRAAAK